MKLSYGTIWRTTDSSPAVKNIDNIFQFVQSQHFTKHMHAVTGFCQAYLPWLHVWEWLQDKPDMKSHQRHKFACAFMTLGSTACPSVTSWWTWNEVTPEARIYACSHDTWHACQIWLHDRPDKLKMNSHSKREDAMWLRHAEVWQRWERMGQGGWLSLYNNFFMRITI